MKSEPCRGRGYHSFLEIPIVHPVGAYCIRPCIYPIYKWIDPKEWAHRSSYPIKIQSILVYVYLHATDVLWSVYNTPLLGYMIIFQKKMRYLRRQHDSPFLFQFSITHIVGVYPRSTHTNPLRRLTYKTNLDSILRTLNDSKTSSVFPLCTLRSRKTKSVFCIPQCADPKNKVCFGTLQCAEPKNRSCFCTPQLAKPKNRLCFPTPQRAEPQNRLCFPTLQHAELPFRVCFYTPQMARQQLNKPFYSHSVYGPISRQTVFPS